MGQGPLPLEFFGLLLFPLHLFFTAQYTLIILPSLIVLLSPSNNRPICPSSLAPASPPAALFSPSSALQWQVLIRELPRPLRHFSKIPPSPSQQPLIWLQAFCSFSEEASPRRTIADQVVSQTLSPGSYDSQEEVRLLSYSIRSLQGLPAQWCKRNISVTAILASKV